MGKRKRTIWNEDTIKNRYDGKMIYNFRYDFWEPFLLILKSGAVIAIILLAIYLLFRW